MFERFESLIGKESINILNNINIIIFGVGGVGCYVAEMLARSGIENITLVDKDTVDITNLNRQIIALNSTIGQNKCDVLRLRLLDINSRIKVNSIIKNIIASDIESMNLEKYDYVVDAIDDISVKKELIRYCYNQDIKFISSMGTARKLKPELLKITTLNKTEYDPLAKLIRHDLRDLKQNKIAVLSSIEQPIKTVNNLGSSAFVPSTAGILIANYIVRDILKIR